MKKCLLVVTCALLLFLTTGCGKKQLKCSATVTEDGVTMKGEVIADLDKDDKIEDATIIYTFDDKEQAETYCSFIKLLEDKDKGVLVDCKDNKITITGYANIEDEEGSDGMVGASKEEFIKAVKEEGFTCEE